MAKIYHPDANVHKDIDTTELMQEILEAYRTLSDPEKRSAYNIEMFGTNEQRVFRTFTVGPDKDGDDESHIICHILEYSEPASRHPSEEPEPYGAQTEKKETVPADLPHERQ